jgi:23S rRNA (adenine2030-N6)-methyltransferase
MLSYQHEYHAGNHADVLKHAVLALMIQALQRKEAPLRVIDAYAGSGVYDLGSPEAGKNREYETGISRILAAASPPDELAPYLGAVGAGPLTIYPGSPQIARHLLRPQDHLELFEMHPRALVALRESFSGEPRVHIHDRDAFEGLPALLPPPERRGVVLIDPSYEVKDDFARVVDLLRHVYRRWPGGTYLAWYPLIAHPDARQFPARVAASGIRRIFRAELRVAADDDQAGRGGLRGSGLLIVNLPFGLQARLEVLLPWLCKTLAVGPGGDWQAAWLVPE